MSDLAQRLRATLAELHRELESVDPADAELRGLMEGAVADLQAHLIAVKAGPLAAAAPSDEGAPPRDASALRNALSELEKKNPGLSANLSGLIDALQQMGL